ncbi:MAG: leucine--tRNA ligase [Flavobacteriales bacterium]|nr:MAG: leucine--tRNA ligase [Flavobacteriales bacterium]
MGYEHKDIEKKWREEWRKRGTYRVENDSSKPKYYVLDMFPYPSGAGLHVGHPLGYIASDIVSRYKRHSGFNVLHPMGYDSFGLPAEQYAIQTGQHPAKTTEVNITRYREQLDNIGFSFDWDREVRTSNPDFYKWTQWIFLQLFDSWYDHAQDKSRPIADMIARFEQQGWNGADECAITGNEEDEPLAAFTAAQWKQFDEKTQRGILMRFRLAYLGEAWVNWCPALGTVLANDEVKDGVSERGGHPVERKRMPQWSMRITAFAQRLLDGLDTLDWSESIKEAQRNWIGKSEGALVRFRLTPALSSGEGEMRPHPALSKGEGEMLASDQTSASVEGDKTDLRFHTADRTNYKSLANNARRMRSEPTLAEDALWQALRGSSLGAKFRRQHVVENYIVDFACLPKQLVVEVDGGSHQERNDEDAERTLQLERHGFKVVRFTNDEVLGNIDNVLERIRLLLEERAELRYEAGAFVPPTSDPSPLERGRGEADPLSTGEGRGEAIEVFTTRPDTLFGVTFVTLAPEHELVERITSADRRAEVMAYVSAAKNRSERERMADVKKVSGVFTGATCIHPFTGAEVPVWVGDYVLGGYGTGAVMAVPGGDQRDWNFATHFGLPIIAVTEGADISKEADERKDATICSEGFLKGLKVPDAITRAIDELEKLGAGERRINFRLRDAAFGRQRYWGEPIPIYYKDGVPYALPEGELPLVLPEVDKFLPTETGEPPLARAKSWHFDPRKAKSPEGARIPPPPPGEAGWGLETTTMPGWAGSSWYFLRYMDPKNEGRFASPEAINYWQQVDLYVGGSEHATGHLLYFRFWTKFLKDRGWINFDEPAKKLVNQGMIQGVSAFTLHTGVMSWFINGTQWLSPGGSPLVYISKGRYDRMIETKDFSPLAEIYARHDSSIDYRATSFVSFAARYKAHVYVDHVGANDLLDITAFRNSRPGQQFELLTEEDGTFICEREVEKMSKSKFNVVNPDNIISKYGADTLRLYEMFLGPIEQSKPWDTNGIEGTFRFLRKFWNLFHPGSSSDAPVPSTHGVDPLHVTDDAPTKPELKILHATLKKVTEDIEKMSFNTSVAQFMIAVNELGSLKCNKRAVLEPLVIALAPFAPHIAEELWEKLGHTDSVTGAKWPQWSAEHLVEDSFSYPISFNGKTRLQLEFPIALDAKSVEAAVLANPEVQQRLEGKPPKKVIVVPKRIVNIVV